MEYKEFVDKLNKGIIKKVVFSISDYAHYKKCLIETKEDILRNGTTVLLIYVALSNNTSEQITFYKKFNEEYKLFIIKGKGRFTLKQVWERVQILELEENFK